MSNESKNLKIMMSANNYHKWIYDNIKDYLGVNILEIGAGMGSMTQLLLTSSSVMSTEVSKNNIKILKQRFVFEKQYNVRFIDVSRKDSIAELKQYRFDTVVCINVLEHIKDDITCLCNIYAILEKDGCLILVLPAFSSVFGTIDESDNHYRRYNKKILTELNRIGFEIVKHRYMNFVGLLGWIWHGKILKLKIHAKKDLKVFNMLVPICSIFEKIIPFLPGLSLIVVCKK